MRVTCFVVCCLLSGSVCAQSLGEDLAFGFLGVQDHSTLVYGEIPSDVPLALVPEGADVIATLVDPPFFPTSAIVVGRLETPPDEAAAVYRRGMASSTWEELTPPEGEHTVTEQNTRFVTLCPPDLGVQPVMIEFRHRPFGGSYFRLGRLDASFSAPCGAPVDMPGSEIVADSTSLAQTLPTLTSPEGMLVISTSIGGSDLEFELGAALANREMGRADLAAATSYFATEFSSEMENLGWGQATAVLESDVAVVLWVMDSRDLVATMTLRPGGHEAMLDIQVSVTAPSDREVTITTVRGEHR